jgi:hypothetical protein
VAAKNYPLQRSSLSLLRQTAGLTALTPLPSSLLLLEIAESYEEYSAQRNLLGAGHEAAPEFELRYRVRIAALLTRKEAVYRELADIEIRHAVLRELYRLETLHGISLTTIAVRTDRPSVAGLAPPDRSQPEPSLIERFLKLLWGGWISVVFNVRHVRLNPNFDFRK